jgi:hypothetical protein
MSNLIHSLLPTLVMQINMDSKIHGREFAFFLCTIDASRFVTLLDASSAWFTSGSQSYVLIWRSTEAPTISGPADIVFAAAR